MRKIIQKIKSRKSLKDILSLTGVQIAIRPIQIVKSFFVAKYLGPEAYGILKSVELISMLNKFGSLGFRPTVIRNAATERAAGNVSEVISIKNNAYSGELILSFLLFIAGLISSLFFKREIISVAIILSSIGLFTAKLFGIVQTELQLEKRFANLSKVILYQGIINAVIVIATVPYFKIYSVLIVPSVSTLFVTILAIKKLGFFFKLKIDKKGFIKVLRISIPLTFGTLAFGLFRYSERILIISYLGLTSVGYFGFADTIAGICIGILLGSVIKVRSMKVYEELGRKNYLLVHKMVTKETLMLIGLSLVFIFFAAIGLKILIPIFLPKWTIAINISILYLFVIPLKLLSSYINIVVKAPAVNKLFFEPVMCIVATIIIVSGLFVLKINNQLTLFNFLIVDLLAYAVLHFSYVLFYYRIFVRKIGHNPPVSGKMLP